MRRTQFLVAVIVIAAITSGAAYWHHRQQADGAIAVSPQAENAASRALAKVKAEASAPPKLVRAAHTHTSKPELQFESPQDFRMEANWFKALSPNADGRFPTSNTPVKFDASCAGLRETSHTTLESAILKEAQFDPAQATPADALVQEIAQFWKLGDNYYKLAGRWERDQPATYRVHLFSAKNPDFSEPLRVMPLPEGLGAQVDLMTLGEALDREVTRAVGAGGERGARLTQVFYPSPSGNETYEVKLHNGQPVSWSFGHGRCQRKSDGDAYCRCVSSSAREAEIAGHTHNSKEEHRAKD